MQISKGKKMTPPKIVIYGPEGIGKSTMASRFPAPLFLDIERGTNRLDVHRVDVGGTYANVQAVIRELTANPQGYETLVIDTADWLDRLIQENVCQNNNASDIVALAYGRGYALAVTEWGKFLDSITSMQAKNGMGVVFCAHALQRKVDVVGETSSYDHWELKLLKQSSPLLKEWADFLFFIKYDVVVMTGKDGKTLPTGGQRVLCTSHTLQYDAKSREQLPAKMPMNKDTLEKILAAIYIPEEQKAESKPDFICRRPATPPATPPAPEPPKIEQPAPEPPKDETPKIEQPAPAPAEATAKPLDAPHEKLKACMDAHGVTMAEINAVVIAKGMYPAGTPFENYNEAACNRLTANFDKIATWIVSKRSK